MPRLEALETRCVLSATSPLAFSAPAVDAADAATHAEISRETLSSLAAIEQSGTTGDGLSPWEEFCLMTSDPEDLGNCLDGLPDDQQDGRRDDLLADDSVGRSGGSDDDHGDELSPWEEFCLASANPEDLDACLDGQSDERHDHSDRFTLEEPDPRRPGFPTPDGLREKGFPSGRHDGPGGYKNPGPDRPDFPPASIELDRGMLQIQGTQEDDNISVYEYDGTIEVEVNDLVQEFDADDVGYVLIYGLAGDDAIINGTAINDTIFGGLDNDWIRAGDGVSYVYGQGGRDILAGDSQVNDGIAGDDFLFGGDDDDFVFGQGGSDVVDGGDGNDFVSGGYWSSLGETVQSNPNDDSEDLLIGGEGADWFCLPDEDGQPDDVMDDFSEADGDEEACSAPV